MVWAELFFTAKHWLWPAAGLFLAALLLLLWNYHRSGLRGPLAALCIGLKLLGLSALLFCLLEPTWVGQRAKPGANYFVILADNSQSLTLTEGTGSRGQFLSSLLQGPSSFWQDPIEENFQLRRYLFDSRLQSTRDFGGLDFQGGSTALQSALTTLEERYEGRPLAGILLFTDGNATDLEDEPADHSNLPPVYPVVLGHGSQARDIAIEKVAVTQTAFEDAPVTVQAQVRAVEAGGTILLAQLWPLPMPDLDATNSLVGPATTNAAPLLEQRLRVRSSDEVVTARFQFRPQSPGLSFYEVRVRLEEEAGNPTLETREATLANNLRLVKVDRGHGPYRILYVSGRPNWEFKFLSRALAEDPEVELVALIRLALREPKFEFKGRRGESSNPLYRGFDRKTEETERYDQPVLIRFNPRDADELQGGFPKVPEDLFNFRAVILDDLEASFFTRDQQMLLQRFVSERGGALLMLGGPRSFQDGDYARTPIGDMLPVYLDLPMPQTHPGPLTFSLTREGWLAPWIRLHENESAERMRLDQMPPFLVLHPSRNIKPAATVVATVTDPRGQTYPALALQRFGRGRVGAMLIGDVWRWGTKDAETHQAMDQSWRQLVRKLIVDVPPFISMRSRPAPDSALEAQRLQVEPRDRSFRPVDNAQVRLRIQGVPPRFRHASPTNPPGMTNAPAGPLVTLTADPALETVGLYEATFVPRHPGAYRVEAVALDDAGVELGRAEAGWTANPAAREFASLSPNRPLLDQLAAKTGGRVVSADELEAFAESLPLEKAPITETWSMPLWHKAWILLFALACFAGEWGLRRWRGLA